MVVPARIVLFVWLSAASVAVLADDPEDELPRHRIDIGTSFLNTIAVDSFVATVGYTYNVTRSSNFNVTLPLIDPDTELSGDSGTGDLIAAYSWVPSLRVGANPWVPRTVGTGIAILAPTGSVSAGRSLDAWIVAPYAGLVLPMTDRFIIAPQAGYIHSLDRTADNVNLRLVYTELGFSFVALNGFWITYLPQLVRDLEAADWSTNHRLSIGKMFSRRFGASIDHAWFERFNFGSDVPGERGYDRQVDLNIHFTF